MDKVEVGGEDQTFVVHVVLVPQGQRVLGIIIQSALDLAVRTALIPDGAADPHVLWLVS